MKKRSELSSSNAGTPAWRPRLACSAGTTQSRTADHGCHLPLSKALIAARPASGCGFPQEEQAEHPILPRIGLP